MSRRFYDPLGSDVFPFNLIIEGVSSTITSKEILATKLTVGVSEIRRFQVVGSDIKANIRRVYGVSSDAFNNNKNILRFIDLDGLCESLGINAFYQSSLIEIIAPNLKKIEANSFRAAVNFTGVNFPKLESLEAGSFHSTKITQAIFPLIKSENIGTLTFINSTVINVNLGGAKYLGTQFFQACTSLLTAVLDEVVTADNGFFYNANKIQNISLPKATTLTLNCCRGATALKTFSAPLLNTITDKTYFFNGNSNCTLIDMKKLKVFGNPANISNCFVGLKTGCIINVNIALKTTNSGAVDAALDYAKNSRGAVVNFYNDDGSYNSTL